MNFEVVQLIRRLRGIGLAERALLFDLAIYASESGEVRVAAQRLAEDLDSDVRRVRRMLGDLLALGVLEVAERGQGRGIITTYRFILRSGVEAIHLKKGGAGAMVNFANGGHKTMVSHDTKTVAHRIKNSGLYDPETVAPAPPPSKGSKVKLDARVRARGPAKIKTIPKTGAALFGRVLDRLRSEVDQESFETWLAGLECDHLDASTVVLVAPTDFFRRWVLHTYGEKITEAARAVLGATEAPELAIVVGDDLDVGQDCQVIEISH